MELAIEHARLNDEWVRLSVEGEIDQAISGLRTLSCIDGQGWSVSRLLEISGVTSFLRIVSSPDEILNSDGR